MKRTKYNRKYTKFMELSRTKRRDKVFALKKEIDKENGLFTSRHYFDEEMHWVDVYFLSRKDKFTLYNCTLVSPTNQFLDKIADKLYDVTTPLLTTEELSKERAFDFVPIVKNGIRSWIMKKPEKVVYEKLGNLTWREYQNQVENELIQNEKIDIYEQYTLDYSYAYGIGLNIVVNEKFINETVVVEYITKFLNNGEKDFISEQPLEDSLIIRNNKYSIDSRACK